MKFTLHARLLVHSVLGLSIGRLEPKMLLKFQVVPSHFGQPSADRKPGRLNEALNFTPTI